MTIFKKKITYPFGPAPPNTQVLWRAKAQRYSVCIDPETELFAISRPKLHLYWYIIVKRTPCGAWIDGKFINLKANKKFACETEEEALTSFKARKTRQIKILEAQLSRAKEELDLLP